VSNRPYAICVSAIRRRSAIGAPETIGSAQEWNDDVKVMMGVVGCVALGMAACQSPRAAAPPGQAEVAAAVERKLAAYHKAEADAVAQHAAIANERRRHFAEHLRDELRKNHLELCRSIGRRLCGPFDEDSNDVDASRYGPGISDYRDLDIGMSLADVQGILNKPGTEDSRSDRVLLMSWEGRHDIGRLSVVFEHAGGWRLVSKSQVGLVCPCN
jgi:hypothetical protein